MNMNKKIYPNFFTHFGSNLGEKFGWVKLIIFFDYISFKSIILLQLIYFIEKESLWIVLKSFMLNFNNKPLTTRIFLATSLIKGYKQLLNKRSKPVKMLSFFNYKVFSSFWYQTEIIKSFVFIIMKELQYENIIFFTKFFWKLTKIY
jgi:hypothetical protein